MARILYENSKGRSWPLPDAANLSHNLCELQKAIRHEEKYKSNLPFSCIDHQPGDVCMSARNRAVHTLRCLRVWFDLPESVFFTAVNFLDRFLTAMKVKEKFLACLSVSCLHISAAIQNIEINSSKLVTISQSKCSVKDLQRMSDIVQKKLGIECSDHPLTVLDYMNLFLKVFDSVAAEIQIRPLYSTDLKKELLARRLEIIMTDSVCASYRPTVVALSLIQTEIEWCQASNIPPGTTCYSVEMLQLLSIVLNLQHLCMVRTSHHRFSMVLRLFCFRSCL